MTGLTEQASKLLTTLMEQEGVSALELSRRAGVAHTTVLRLLRDEHSPSLDTCDRILAGLGYAGVLDIRTL